MIIHYLVYLISFIFILNILFNYNKDNYENNYRNKFIVIYPINGLCNRIRFIMTHLKNARKRKKKLIVIWELSDECPGFFLDYFEHIKDIYFIKDKKNLTINYTGHNGYIYNLNNEIKLKSYMKYNIMSKIKKLDNKYIAIHVRRTDLIENIHNFPENWGLKDINNINIESYKKYDSFIDLYPDYNLYIATDNRNTQDYFYNKYKDRINVIKFINTNNNLRQTSLEDSIIDMYMCIYANHFMGTSHSTFTIYINTMRKKQ